MEKLTEQLDKLVTKLRKSHKFNEELQQMESESALGFPFNRSLRILSLSLSNNIISFDEYVKIRDDFLSVIPTFIFLKNLPLLWEPHGQFRN